METEKTFADSKRTVCLGTAVLALGEVLGE